MVKGNHYLGWLAYGAGYDGLALLAISDGYGVVTCHQVGCRRGGLPVAPKVGVGAHAAGGAGGNGSVVAREATCVRGIGDFARNGACLRHEDARKAIAATVGVGHGDVVES